MSQSIILLDPTAETAPAKRQRKTPPETLEGLTVERPERFTQDLIAFAEEI